MTTTHDLAPQETERATQRRLLASTPPARRWGSGGKQTARLIAHPFEDLVIRTIARQGHLIVPRLDASHRHHDLTDEHIGAIRVFDRGLITLLEADTKTATWTWTDQDSEAEGLRLLRHRSLGFWPYYLGYHGFTPELMSGPQLVAMLAWHYRLTDTARLDIAVISPTVLRVILHHSQGPTTHLQAPIVRAPAQPFESHTRHINPHQDNPGQVFPDDVLAHLLTHLALRVARQHFRFARLTIDLNTWHLAPYGHGPASFTQSLPLDTQDALATLAAPEFATSQEFLDWATQHLTMTVMCRLPAAAGHRAGARKHTIHLDPITGTVSTVHGNNAAQRDDLDGVHLLAALHHQSDKLRCSLVAEAWAKDGHLASTPDVQWTDLQRERVQAAHRVAHTARSLIPAAI